MIGVVSQGTMQREHVADGEQAVEGGLLQALGQVAAVLAGEREDIHAKLARDGGNLHADAAQADDAHGLAAELDEGRVPIDEVRIAAPASLTVLAGIVAHAMSDVQNMGEGELCHAVGTVGRYVGDDDALFASRLHVDHIISCGEHADILQHWQLGHHRGCDHDLVGEHGIGLSGPCENFIRGSAVVDRQLAQRLHSLPAHIARIGCISIKYYNLHKNQK